MSIGTGALYFIFTIFFVVVYIVPFCFAAYFILKSMSSFNAKVGFYTLNPFQRIKQQLDLRSQDPNYAKIGSKSVVWIVICILSWTVGTSIGIGSFMYAVENRIVVIVDDSGNEIKIPNLSDKIQNH